MPFGIGIGRMSQLGQKLHFGRMPVLLVCVLHRTCRCTAMTDAKGQQPTFVTCVTKCLRLGSGKNSIWGSMRKLTKLDVARHQLGTALDLFIRNRDPIAVQCLACGGGELIEGIATISDLRPFTSHILETVPNIDIRGIRTLQRQYWNSFKHLTSRDGEVRDDNESLASFDDTKNDAALFIGWHDYFVTTTRLPLAAQVFQIWYYALNEGKLAPGADLDAIRTLFPDIRFASRSDQKRRLRRTVEKYRDDKATLADPRTEDVPLCISADAFVANWEDGLEEDIAYLAEHDPKSLTGALNHAPPGEGRRRWIKLCVAMARKRHQATDGG